MVRMFVLMKSRMTLKMGQVGSKTRSLRQILGKPCVRSRGHIFNPIIMKLGQKVSLDVSGHVLSGSDSTLPKCPVVRYPSRKIFKMGHVRSKTRSLGQILEKHCVRSRGHIFSPIIMKLSQNVCLDEVSDEFKIWSCRLKN